jgi:hypothetical protein
MESIERKPAEMLGRQGKGGYRVSTSDIEGLLQAQLECCCSMVWVLHVLSQSNCCSQ